MPRIRTLKPEFFRHEVLQELEVSHPVQRPMLVFAALWGHCDKHGRFEWRPKQLKLDVLPFVDFDLSVSLELLAQHGFLRSYEVDGKRFGQVLKFLTHQRISGKEVQVETKIPPPPGELRPVLGEAPGKHLRSTGEAPVKHPGSTREAPGTAGSGSGSGSGSGRGTGSGSGTGRGAEPPPPPKVIHIPLRDGSNFACSGVLLRELAARYPRVDAEATLEVIRQHFLDHPERQYTRPKIEDRIFRWFSDDEAEYQRRGVGGGQ